MGQTLVLRLLRCGVRHRDRRVELRRGVPAPLLIELVVALVVACETVPRGGCGDVAAQRAAMTCAWRCACPTVSPGTPSAAAAAALLTGAPAALGSIALPAESDAVPGAARSG